MSRIGKLPITVPSGVTVTIGEDNLVTIKGPKGTLSQKVHKDITVKHEGAVNYRFPSVGRQAAQGDARPVSGAAAQPGGGRDQRL